MKRVLVVVFIVVAISSYAFFKLQKMSGSFSYVNDLKHSINTQFDLVVPEGKTIVERFLTPQSFKRIIYEQNSFAYYLQHLPLKKHGADVLLYNGNTKYNKVHAAVVNIDVGKKDLQQCADAVMRLRAEYLYKEKAYNNISFNFTNGFAADYKRWRNGERIRVNGNQCSWYSTQSESSSYSSFRQYLDMVFSYAGTLSLSKQLSTQPLTSVKPGDVFIQGGSPGHAVIVVDVCSNSSGEKLFMLAQSYMPAQEIHVLKNMNEPSISPWYRISKNQTTLQTPEWTFNINNLKSF
jgi:hypothetical protein